MAQYGLKLLPFNWLAVKDGDERAYAIFRNHYSFSSYTDGRRKYGYRNKYLIAGPGQKIVLITQEANALFVWRKFIDKSNQRGVNCAIFRNESDILSSQLIKEAEEIAWNRWPGSRLYTYVNAKKIRSTNPGFCFKQAGWRVCGKTKARNLVILEKLPLWT